MSEPTAEPTFSEQVEDEAVPREKPEGSPDLIPFKAVPRRRRADMMRAFETVQGKQDELEAIKAESEKDDAEGSTAGRAAVIFDLLADCEEMLTFAAVDAEVFRTWASSCEDNDLMALFGWYCSRFQMGEG